MPPRRSKRTDTQRRVVPRKAALLVALTTVGLGLGVGLGGCYHGFDVEDKQPPPGHPGGSCVQDDCYQPYACISAEQVCLRPRRSVQGHLLLRPRDSACSTWARTSPVCSCDVGYSNEVYAYFCTPIGL